MSESNQAVFLSYASQDAEAARRIADALRAAGVEVWFDQNELVGGDQWDVKIRGQISSCALFVPLISSNTQARLEGYFRLEWKLAAQRTHTMADEKTFLLPVVIDTTRDPEAKVPVEFKSVQWTRLRPSGYGGQARSEGEDPALAKLVERVKRLLSDGSEVARFFRPVGSENTGQETRATKKLKRARWLLPAIIGAAAVIGFGLWRPWRSSEKLTAPPIVAGVPVAHVAAAPLTDAQKLVQQAQKIYESGDELDRETLILADELVKRALALDAAEPTALLLGAQLSYAMVWQSFDSSEARKADLQRQAMRARMLAPESVPAQLALANARIAVAYSNFQSASNRQDLADVEQDLLALAAQAPDNYKVQRALGQTYRFLKRPDEALRALQRAHELSGGDPAAAGDIINVLLRRKRYAEAEAMVAPALARRPIGRMLALDVLLKLQWRGDLAGALGALAAWPGWLLREDRGAFIAWQTWLWSRRPDMALDVAQRLPRDYLRDVWFTGPRAVLTARAHELAGNREAAQADWHTAVRLADQELAGSPEDAAALFWKAWALSRLGDQTGAEAAATLLQQRMTSQTVFFNCTNPALLWSTMGRTDLAAEHLRANFVGSDDAYAVTRAMLELDPAYAPLRASPQFAALASAALAPAAEQVQVDPKSVAVLAFANLSDDKANEYFSDGISEELLNVLAKVPKLKVAARTSSFSFKGQNVPVPEIAQKLGVAYVVEGSVRKAGNKVRITAQLIKAADGFHVWSETYDRELTDIFAVQDEIAKNILGIVKGSLLGEAELPHTATTDTKAYALFLQAQGQLAIRSQTSMLEAERLFVAALAIDPDYVPALVGLARTRFLLPSYVSMVGPKVRLIGDQAKQAAQHALELEPRNAGALAAHGSVLSMAEWRWAEGEAELLRARELAPNDAWVANLTGDYFMFTANVAEALAAKRKWLELDPLSPASHWDLGFACIVAGDYNQAVHWGEEALKMAPNSINPYLVIALAAGRAGRFDLMRQTLATARRDVQDDEGLHRLLEAHCAILEKRTDEAHRIMAEVVPLAEKGEASPAYLGYCYLLLGESDQALVWLQRGYEQRDQVLAWRMNIDFAEIAADPTTRSLLELPGLKELNEIRLRNARDAGKKP